MERHLISDKQNLKKVKNQKRHRACITVRSIMLLPVLFRLRKK